MLASVLPKPVTCSRSRSPSQQTAAEFRSRIPLPAPPQIPNPENQINTRISTPRASSISQSKKKRSESRDAHFSERSWEIIPATSYSPTRLGMPTLRSCSLASQAPRDRSLPRSPYSRSVRDAGGRCQPRRGMSDRLRLIAEGSKPRAFSMFRTPASAAARFALGPIRIL